MLHQAKAAIPGTPWGNHPWLIFFLAFTRIIVAIATIYIDTKRLKGTIVMLRDEQRPAPRTPWHDGTGTARRGIPPIDSGANAPHIVPCGPNHIWLVEVQVV